MSPAVGIWDVEFGIWDLGDWDIGFRIWDMGYGIWGSMYICFILFLSFFLVS